VVIGARRILVATLLIAAALCAQEAPGTLRGSVTDADFGGPVPEARVQIVETGRRVTASAQGDYVVPDLPAGRYTVVFSKDGYVKLVRGGVTVSPGAVAALDAALAPEYVELEEFVVEDAAKLETSNEAGLLQLRFETPALLDSVGSELLSRAGASDAAGALRLVAGATVSEDGKSAVVRGLPDRYVSSQLNGVRLPTAVEDKRAVELDQFPSAVIDSVQVAKTFTPDQQGDASGGAVNIRLKSVPKDPLFFRFSLQRSWNSQVAGEDGFLSYDGGGVRYFGRDDGRRDIQTDNLGSDWDGAVGVSPGDIPTDYKWSASGGGRTALDEDWSLGGSLNVFYERDSSFFDNGRDDSYVVQSAGGPLVPQTSQQTGASFTKLFDITEASQSVQWGTLATLGVETEGHKIGLSYTYTRTTEDTARLSEDVRGKEYFFPGHDPYDPNSPGHTDPNTGDDLTSLYPYQRLQTLNYSERSTGSLQLRGEHELPVDGFALDGVAEFGAPVIDWTVAYSTADLNQPDKRVFAEYWVPQQTINIPIPGFPPIIIPAQWRPRLPSESVFLGNLQRIYKEIEEVSDQYQLNVKLPFKQWDGEEGFLKTGLFYDSVVRTFDQETFSNFNDTSTFDGDFSDYWSDVFPTQTGQHAIGESLFDVDYEGRQKVSAWYAMLDLPLSKEWKLTTGARFERTAVSIVNFPEANAVWYPIEVPPGSIPTQTTLNPGDGDASFRQADVLPSLGLEYKALDELTLRGAWSKTIARPNFKELSPIVQQEFIGGPVFVGNPDLGMSKVTNYDLRADYVPYEGGLVSVSWFRKDVRDPIEYVEVERLFSFTTARNYPEGKLTGWEFEARQALGHFVDDLAGLSLGANATLIESEVTLPDDEVSDLAAIGVPLSVRDMTNAPEYLLNLYLTYEIETTGTTVGLFYTRQGDTLLAGAGTSDLGSTYVPSVYAKPFGTLNLSVDQKLGENLKLRLQAKNLTNTDVETVFRTESGDEATETFKTSGVEFSIALTGEFRF
jgi:outer membrane receptor protein involved in Fe transport